MYCRICGIEINETNDYCPKCGTRTVKIATMSPLFKNPGHAAVMSTILPGFGQIYNGQIAKGIALIVAVIASVVLSIAVRSPERLVFMPVYFIVWTYGITDAYKSAEKMNLKLE